MPENKIGTDWIISPTAPRMKKLIEETLEATGHNSDVQIISGMWGVLCETFLDDASKVFHDLNSRIEELEKRNRQLELELCDLENELGRCMKQ